MKVFDVDTLKGTDREVQFTGGTSLRPILASDNMGFTFCKTFVPEGGPHHWHYKNHLECCYCISGRGELVNLTTHKVYEIVPDTIYILDKHDDHTFKAITDCVLISIFNPPLNGNESHDKNGVYGNK